MKPGIYKLKKISLTLFLILLTTDIIHLVGFRVTASELTDVLPDKDIELELEKAYDRFESGMLDIPDRFCEEIILYKWVADAVEQYLTEKGIEDTFYCDIRREMIYNRQFVIWGGDTNSEGREYSIQIGDKTKFTQNNYWLKLEGTTNILYLNINIQEEMIYLYPKSDFIVIVTCAEIGNPKVYDALETDEDNIIIYPDIYVESDWDDMEIEDGHFAGVSYNELQNLDFLKLPENMHFHESVYLSVASILKRYMQEQQIEDVFYLDLDEDIISNVMSGIYTCRVRGKEHTLYIDIDEAHMKCHVYEVEE